MAIYNIEAIENEIVRELASLFGSYNPISGSDGGTFEYWIDNPFLALHEVCLQSKEKFDFLSLISTDYEQDIISAARDLAQIDLRFSWEKGQ